MIAWADAAAATTERHRAGETERDERFSHCLHACSFRDVRTLRKPRPGLRAAARARCGGEEDEPCGAEARTERECRRRAHRRCRQRRDDDAVAEDRELGQGLQHREGRDCGDGDEPRPGPCQEADRQHRQRHLDRQQQPTVGRDGQARRGEARRGRRSSPGRRARPGRRRPAQSHRRAPHRDGGGGERQGAEEEPGPEWRRRLHASARPGPQPVSLDDDGHRPRDVRPPVERRRRRPDPGVRPGERPPGGDPRPGHAARGPRPRRAAEPCAVSEWAFADTPCESKRRNGSPT